MNRNEAINFLITEPVKLCHALGFTLLQDLHNDWIVDMVVGKGDKTLQAHRGSYKTTCVAFALALIIILLPNKRTCFIRKTDTDTREIVAQVKKILDSEYIHHFVKVIHGVELAYTVNTQTEISTNLTTDIKGTVQLYATGIKGSLTGKHFDFIFTDDIVNISDRISKAERDYTKTVYQELQNIKNRGGRIYNTGTPWHKDDAFTLMPNIEKYDCYSTGLITPEQLESIRQSMEASLFSANYELKHIASEDVIFTSPQKGADPALAEQGECHIDAAYGGSDYTAFTICNKKDGKYYIFGKLWHSHVDDCLDTICKYREQFNAGKIFCEDNGDKGYLAKDLRNRGERVSVYHEKMNKYIKITSYLKASWKDVIFVEGTDEEYINQICDYNENAEHDDAPDSAASIVRRMFNKSDSEYTPLWMYGCNEVKEW